MKNKTIVCWFSCGVASMVAAKLTMDRYGQENRIILANNPIKEEHEDNKRFLSDCEKYLGVSIESVINKKYPSHSAVDVWEDRKYMSGIHGAPCTVELKRKARQDWERNNPHDYMVMGYTFEEKKRHEKFVLTERENLLPVLIESELTKQDCYDLVLSWGIKPPLMYELGFPNANCIGCVKATSPTYWNLVREKFPEIFKERLDLSHKLGVKLARYKGKRLELKDLPANARGQSLKSMNIECSIFCSE